LGHGDPKQLGLVLIVLVLFVQLPLHEFPVLICHVLGRILAWSLGFGNVVSTFFFTNLCLLLFILAPAQSANFFTD